MSTSDRGIKLLETVVYGLKLNDFKPHQVFYKEEIYSISFKAVLCAYQNTDGIVHLSIPFYILKESTKQNRFFFPPDANVGRMT